MKAVSRVVDRLSIYANRWWYAPLIAFLAAADAYIFVVPIEVLLIPAVLMHRRHWLRIANWVTGGSAVGATSFAFLAHRYGDTFIEWILPHATRSKEWHDFVEVLDRYGGFGLGAISFSPFPQHLAVAIAGLGHMKMTTIFVAVLIGRGIKYIGLAWCVFHSPRILRRLRLLPEGFDPEGKRDASPSVSAPARRGDDHPTPSTAHGG